MQNELSPTIKNPPPYCGVIVPMVTPVTPAGALDEPAVRRVIDHLIRGGVDGIFVLGTTGEAASLSQEMRLQLVKLTLDCAKGATTVYAGISHNSLASAVAAADAYCHLGVDVLVAHLPAYYDLNPEEQEVYFLTLSQKIKGPLMLYNMPGTTHMSLPIEVIVRLSEQPNIVGLKDSERDVDRLTGIMEVFGSRDDFSVLVGVTTLSTTALDLGAHGTVPSLGNLAPDLCQKLYKSAVQGEANHVRKYQQQLDDLGRLLRGQFSLGQSLGATKAAMGALALCGPDVLPPLQPLSETVQHRLQQEFIDWHSKL